MNNFRVAIEKRKRVLNVDLCASLMNKMCITINAKLIMLPRLLCLFY